MENYDVAIIGGGPGGYVCAIRCAQEGLKSVLIEKSNVGGTCLNVGCIPTKTLLQSASVYNSAKEAETFGVSCEKVSLDFAKVMKRKDEVVSKLRRGVEGLVKGNGCKLLKGEASFIDANTLCVKSSDGKEEKISFKKAVIATGSSTVKLPIEGLDSVNWVDSDGFLSLQSCPEKVVIIGTGVIGIEFGTFLNTIGTKVTMIDILPDILNGTDKDITATLKAKMERNGVEFHQNSKILKFEKDGKDSVCVFEKDGKTEKIAADLIIMAAGRRPNTKGLNCEAAGVKMSDRGFINVDDTCMTNVSNIYAIGDVNGKAMLAHAASAQGMTVSHNIAKSERKKADFDLIPACIYTEPEIAGIGLTEEAAKKKGIDVVVGKFASAGNGKSLVVNETEGFAKVVADKKTGEILGMQLFCAHATDMIGEGIAAMKLESTLCELGDAIHPHPTVNEMIMEAVHDAMGHSAHTIKRK